MNAVTMPGYRSEKMIFNDRVKDAAVGMGMFEILNYSFISPRWIEALGLAADDARLNTVVIRNPLGEDTSVMRTSLAPSMLNTMAANLNRGVAEGRLFELSKTFAPAVGPGRAAHGEERAVHRHVRRWRGFLRREERGGLAAGQVRREGRSDRRRRRLLPSGPQGRAHRRRREAGDAGRDYPDVAERFGIDKRVYVAEVDLDALRPMEKPFYGVKPLPRFPAVTRDLAVVVDESVGAGAMLETIRKAAKNLEEVRLFDIYRGEKLGAGRKSVAYAMSFRAPDRTLTDEEIAAAMSKILKTLSEQYQAEIR